MHFALWYKIVRHYRSRVWALAGILISSLLLVWVRLENGNAEAMALTDTLLRVPISVVVGVLVGALVAVLSTRESHLLKYFKNR